MQKDVPEYVFHPLGIIWLFWAAAPLYLFADPAPGPLGHVDREDGVAPIGLFVEVMLGGRAHQFASVKEVQGFLL